MKKSSKKSLLVVAGVMAMCAVAAPMAPAASWGVIGTTHNLTSTNLGFTSHTAAGAATWGCALSSVTADVVSAATLRITNAVFGNCTSTGALGHCTVTMQATGLPWSVTAPTTGNIQIDGVILDLTFENVPGGNACGTNGAKGTVTGTLIGGSWDAAAHQMTFSNDHGLFFHFPLLAGTFTTTATGAVRDATQTLTLI